MKPILVSLFFFIGFLNGIGQNLPTEMGKLPNRKGSFYAYWGWNRGTFSNSDIRFVGSNYDFTLTDVVAKDRQSKFDFSLYFSPKTLTIPQYNFRVGYFISDKYSISLGADHMKYVVQGGQSVKINGNISKTGTIYDKTYVNEDILINEGFLKFEHTDGLNYINTELRRFDPIFQYKKLQINVTEGAGFGFMMPRTNATLLNFERHDEFHISGYGFSGLVGLNIGIGKYFFIQSEYKAGYINMPNIWTTYDTANDYASQHFWFGQVNILFGCNFGYKK